MSEKVFTQPNHKNRKMRGDLTDLLRAKMAERRKELGKKRRHNKRKSITTWREYEKRPRRGSKEGIRQRKGKERKKSGLCKKKVGHYTF